MLTSVAATAMNAEAIDGLAGMKKTKSPTLANAGTNFTRKFCLHDSQNTLSHETFCPVKMSVSDPLSGTISLADTLPTDRKRKLSTCLTTFAQVSLI